MGEPKTILLVEDDAILAMSEGIMLRKEGYRVEVVYSGEEAVALVKARPDAVDLILMDINLGYGMDGTQAAQEILREHNIPVIFLSAHTEREVVEKTEKITSYGYVVKNTGSVVLAASIKMAFKLQAAHQALQKTNEQLSLALEERKQAEKALTHSHDLMSYVIEHSRSAVAIHDRDLNYIYVSQQYLTDYKIQEKDVIGRHHYEVFPDLPQKWRDVHQRALAGEVLSAEDDPYVRADGTVDWTRWECRPWYEADGSVGGIIVYTEVITQRKQVEEALKQSLQEKDRLLQELHQK